MRGVGVEETATVGPEILDRLLRGRWTHFYCLLSSIDLGHFFIGAENLDRALPHEYDGQDYRQRDKDPQDAACQIYPEVADLVCLLPRKSPDERNDDAKAGCGR